MKTAILQMPIQLGDFRANLDTLQHMLASAMEQRPDVVLLPELWDVGYYPHPISEHADPNGERICKVLAELAAKYQVNIVGGSAAIRINDNVFNTCYVFNRSGQLAASYDKTHLFAPGGEKFDFTPGDRLVTYTLDGIKCATLICYDIRFPEAARSLALQDIAVLFVPAAWPASRIMHWNTLLRASAGAVGLLGTVLQHVAQQVEVLLHARSPAMDFTVYLPATGAGTTGWTVGARRDSHSRYRPSSTSGTLRIWPLVNQPHTT